MTLRVTRQKVRCERVRCPRDLTELLVIPPRPGEYKLNKITFKYLPSISTLNAEL